jgi:hypothetical protein
MEPARSSAGRFGAGKVVEGRFREGDGYDATVLDSVR